MIERLNQPQGTASADTRPAATALSPPRRAMWAVAAFAALLAPSRFGATFDGIPLDLRFEAVLIGMVVPLLFVLDPHVFERVWARRLVVMLLAVKVAGFALLTTSGLCTRFQTDEPVRGPVGTIAIDEPSGLMRSWDIRAHWGDGDPPCSAITRRDYANRARFPAAFLNVLLNTNPPHRELTTTMRGVVTVGESGTLSFDAGPAAATLAIDGEVARVTTGGRLDVLLTPGSHHVELRARLAGDTWRLVPSWNGGSLWSSALVTIAPPSTADRVLWPMLPLVTTALVVAFVGFWAFTAILCAPLDARSCAWLATAGIAAGICAWTPGVARFAPLALGVTVLAPAARRDPDWRGAMWLVGVPWLVVAGVLSFPRLDEFTLYSPGDDWLTYQVSAHRIYLQGYWLEAGEPLFYYQPFYRWIAGALHIVFGDSSGSETFWDGACLLVGALLAFVVSRPRLGGQAALGAAALTLMLFSLTPIWHLIGRGLAEISAGAFAWTAALLLTRAHVSGLRVVLAAGVFGVLAFYTRLNHVLFAGSLVVFLLPLGMPAAALRRPQDVLRSLRPSHAATFAAVLAGGVAMLSLRAWFYAGEVSPLAGTSLGLNHTGLALNTLLSIPMWQKVFHSLFAEMIVNEVFDPRGLPVYAGCLAALVALVQVPWFVRLPLVSSVAIVGALAGALIAHAHGYPGRFSVHLVPLAAATAMIAGHALVRREEQKKIVPAQGPE